ncbi:MAG: hypothetical protein COA85_06890 [Robiginitomaculum sp.]|nr:MAG: hypothetical protein COA85_06890 [Robiginitomaculum sp.]
MRMKLNDFQSLFQKSIFGKVAIHSFNDVAAFLSSGSKGMGNFKVILVLGNAGQQMFCRKSLAR